MLSTGRRRPKNRPAVAPALIRQPIREVEECPTCEGVGFVLNLDIDGGEVKCPQCKGEQWIETGLLLPAEAAP